MFEQLKTKKFNQLIIEQIKTLIENGTLKKGDKLPSERTLAEQFGTSRASIREAMSALDMMGVIETRTGSGNYIKIDIEESQIDEALIREILANHELFDIYEAREAIEPSLIYLAAERRTENDLKEFKKINDKLDKISKTMKDDTKKIYEYMEEDRKFHLKIAEMSHNPILFKLYASISLLLKEETWLELKRVDILNKGANQTELEHREIAKSIIDGDSNEAKEKLHIHLQRIKEGLLFMVKAKK